MKKNMLKTMERLNIDNGIRELIRQLWKHNYRTLFSCEGNDRPDAYVIVENNGDGWLEENIGRYCLTKKVSQGDCCEMTKERFSGRVVCCGYCGAGLDEKKYYKGKLIPNPFNPLL